MPPTAVEPLHSHNNLESAYISIYKHHSLQPHSSIKPTKPKHIYHQSSTMRVLFHNLNLSYADPRDGGAPNPGAKSRQSASMMAMAVDEPQPRDGG
ncbi:hypothetical protein EJ02DRAFT_44411 [Clathrospora elynae]|uniref:Uncharacterized protein n=1 Tax=Clathrospora elynae TaxID=706981 RepID=A0A6A5SXQ0_9PLEO|nr:hypothetical protein EJ02DRAFT_44411 [Clathrospora elynae]